MACHEAPEAQERRNDAEIPEEIAAEAETSIEEETPEEAEEFEDDEEVEDISTYNIADEFEDEEEEEFVDDGLPYEIDYSVRPRMSSDGWVRQPDLPRAENLAYLAILEFGEHFPTDPKRVLKKMNYVNLFTFDEAAEKLGMKKLDFERRYGDMEAFTIRQIDYQSHWSWAVVYKPRTLMARERFTLAHELAHVYMRHDGHSAADEIEANHFAACFLAPRVVLDEKPGERRLTKMAFVTNTMAKKRLEMPPQPIHHAFEVLMAMWWRFEQGNVERHLWYHRETQRMLRAGELFRTAVQWPEGNCTLELYPSDVGRLELTEEMNWFNEGVRPLNLPDMKFEVGPKFVVRMRKILARPFEVLQVQDVCPFRKKCKRTEGCALDWSRRYSHKAHETHNEFEELVVDYCHRRYGCYFTMWIHEAPKRRKSDGAMDFLMIPGGKQEKRGRKGGGRGSDVSPEEMEVLMKFLRVMAEKKKERETEGAGSE